MERIAEEAVAESEQAATAASEAFGIGGDSATSVAPDHTTMPEPGSTIASFVDPAGAQSAISAGDDAEVPAVTEAQRVTPISDEQPRLPGLGFFWGNLPMS